MPFDPSSLSDKAFWFRAKNASTGAATTLTDESGGSHNAAGSGGTITAASTPSGGNALVGTSMGYIPSTNVGMPHSNLIATASTDPVGYPAAFAVDGNTTVDNPWAASTATGWLRVEQRSGTPIVATSYQITGRSGGLTNENPKTWTFEGSMDGSSWTTLDTQTNVTSWASLETKSFSFSNSTAYTYYRLNITANNGASFNVSVLELQLNGTANVAQGGELWMVLKSNGGSGPQSWAYGTSASASHFTYSGDVYDDTGSTARRNFTPSVSVASWRLYRVVVDGTNWTAYLDNVSQLTTSSATMSWRGDVKVLDSFSGQVAEILLVGKALTSGEAADLITYFNTEHGLSVPGGSSGTDFDGTVAGTSGTEGALLANRLVAGQVDAVSATEGSLGSAATYNIDGQVDATSGVEGDLLANRMFAGQVNAVSGAQGSLGGTTSLAFDFSAKADLTVASATITLGFLSFDFKTKANLTLGAPLTVTTMALDFAAKPDLNAAFARRHTVDPVTGLPQYRLVAVQADGTRLAELPRAAIGDLTEEIGLHGTKLDFTLPKYDATNAFVLPVKGEQIREVQVWRGPNLETWQRVDGARPDAQTIDYDCSGLGGYLDDRMIGKFPKTDLLVNGSFALGDYGWSYTSEPTSVPHSPPLHSIVTVDFFGTKAKALQLTGADKIETHTQSLETAAVFVPNSASFLAGGAAKITAEAHDIPAGTTSIVIEGHTAYAYIDGDYGDGLALSLARANAAKPLVQVVHPTATITTVGKGRFKPVASNDTHAGQAKNRRVEFHYTSTVTAAASSAQYAKGSLTSGTITVPIATKRAVPVTFKGWANLTSYLAASQHGYGVHLQIVKQSAPSVVVDSAYSQLDETTPVGVWERHEATVTVPADGQTYLFDVRFYAPGGVVQWTQGGVYPEEALHFPDDDQALIAKGIIEHVQDPAMGKLGDTPILIGTRTPLTGTKRTKTYPYHERRTASDALGELGSMHGGMDMRVGFDETTRWVETHYPRLGNTVPVTLALGSNVIAYDAPTDATAAGTRWIAQALESSGADREEGMAEDLSGLGGMLVERLAYSEPGTAVTELTQTAVASLKRNGHPIAALEVTIGLVTGSIAAQVELTNYMLDRVKVGDVVGVEIIDGPIVIIGPHRVIRRRLTPATDQLRYSLAPEV